MTELEKRLQEAARQLLAEGKVELVIGFERGTLPLRTTPCLIRDPDQVNRLVWDATCGANLATYLPQGKSKVGIVAKGCDARSIVVKVVERQIARENVVIIGVPCAGVIDRHKLDERVNGRGFLEAHIAQDQVTLRTADTEQTLELAELLYDGCATCSHRNPPVYDVLVGEPQQEQESVDDSVEAQAIEAQSADERWSYFSGEFSRCIRCYACREACPSCYCPECFVDQTQPSWLGKSDELSDVMVFHLVRTLHLAGRCLDCGACSRACPMHIDLRSLRRKLQKDVHALYGYEAGLDLDTVPPLATFRADDPQEFIK